MKKIQSGTEDLLKGLETAKKGVYLLTDKNKDLTLRASEAQDGEQIYDLKSKKIDAGLKQLDGNPMPFPREQRISTQEQRK